MSSLESQIDDLYKEPLDGFTSARNALAKTLSGDDAKRVKALQKPTAVAWALNQLYWRHRASYDRVISAGDKLRAAQIAGLKGKSADVRGPADSQRQTIAAAAAETLRLASATGLHLDADDLARTLDALSLAPTRPTHPGRLTRPLQPAGFESLAGIVVASRPQGEPPNQTPTLQVPPVRTDRKHAAEALRRQREEEAAERSRTAAIKKARSALARLRAAEARAHDAWDRAKQEREEAERQLATLES